MASESNLADKNDLIFPRNKGLFYFKTTHRIDLRKFDYGMMKENMTNYPFKKITCTINQFRGKKRYFPPTAHPSTAGAAVKMRMKKWQSSTVE